MNQLTDRETTTIAEAFSWLVQWLDECNLVVMVIVAVFLRLLATQLKTDLPWKPAVRFFSFFFLMVYFLHLSDTIQWFDDAPAVVGLFIRISLATFVFNACVAVPFIFFAHLVARYLQSEIVIIQKLSKELAAERKKRKLELQNQDATAITAPREEIMRRNAIQAQRDYEFECSLLRRAGLDDDELEVALSEAKQKYLLRLRDVVI